MYPKYDEKPLSSMCLLEAKRCIARSWKKTTVCGVSEWLNGVTSSLALEKISYFTKTRLIGFGVFGEFFIISWKMKVYKVMEGVMN